MNTGRLYEGGRGLLRQILEAQGNRRRTAGISRGFGMKLLPALEHTLVVGPELEPPSTDRPGVEIPQDLSGSIATHAQQA